MKRAFMDQDFLLSTETAKTLYHQYAAPMPVVDYHCHINPAEIAADRQFSTITQAWLGGDHYKWRAIRANGIPEEQITGAESDDWEKFQMWAKTLPKLIGNPLYHWTHLELQHFFGIRLPLNAETARSIYDEANRILNSGLTVREMIRRSNVRVICTTDDPVDDLACHEKLAADPSCPARVYPAWRPDKAVNIGKEEFPAYLSRLAETSQTAVDSFSGLCRALSARLDYFCQRGCRVSDHGLDAVVYRPAAPEQVEGIFQKRLAGEALTVPETEQYQTALLLFLGEEYARRGIVMQLHYGAARNCNSRMFARLGPDTGFDAVAPGSCAPGLAPLLDALERLQMPMDGKPDWDILEYNDFPYLHIHLTDECDLFQLNALADRLARLDERQKAAFEGLLQVEVSKKYGPIQISTIIDLAYSTDCCHVLSEVQNDSQLGRFYAENGFMPELDAIPDSVFQMLDFEMLGRKARMDEGGVFTSHGYVTQDSDLEQVYDTLDLRLRRPDYAVLMELTNGEHNVSLPLPASHLMIDNKLKSIGAEAWQNIRFRCLDCAAPALKDLVDEAVSITHVNRLAQHLARLGPEELTKYKAILIAEDPSDINEASRLAGQLDEYMVEPDVRTMPEVAENELRIILGDEAAELLLPHVTLWRYGEALLQKYGSTVTEYGLVERRDGQVMAEQPQRGGMEMM